MGGRSGGFSSAGSAELCNGGGKALGHAVPKTPAGKGGRISAGSEISAASSNQTIDLADRVAKRVPTDPSGRGGIAAASPIVCDASGAPDTGISSIHEAKFGPWPDGSAPDRCDTHEIIESKHVILFVSPTPAIPAQQWVGVLPCDATAAAEPQRSALPRVTREVTRSAAPPLGRGTASERAPWGFPVNGPDGGTYAPECRPHAHEHGTGIGRNPFDPDGPDWVAGGARASRPGRGDCGYR